MLAALSPAEAGAKVKPGVEVLRDDGYRQLAGKRVGLITNPTGVDTDLRSTADLLHSAPEVNLTALFAPEHGVRGDIAAGATVAGGKRRRHRPAGALSLRQDTQAHGSDACRHRRPGL